MPTVARAVLAALAALGVTAPSLTANAQPIP
jgi:hypothetical protein